MHPRVRWAEFEVLPGNTSEVTHMTNYVIGPDVALRLAQEDAAIADEHKLLAPTLLRSQLLSMLYRAVRRGGDDED